MSFAIYPDAETAVLLGTPDAAPVQLQVGSAMTEFAPLKELVSPADPLTRGMTFIRLAFSGTVIPETIPQAQPTIELRAHHPGGTVSDARRIHPSEATSLPQAVSLKDGTRTSVQAFFSPPYDDNVYLLNARIVIPGTKLSLKITNTTGAQRDLVWVVADNESETRQPWLQASVPNGAHPNQVGFVAEVGDPKKESIIEVTNRGTGAVTVGVMPPVAPPYTITGLRLTLDPNPPAPAPVTIGFDVPNVPGKIAATQHRFAAPDGREPGPFAVNQTFSISAETKVRTVSPPPPTDVLGPCLGVNGTNPCGCREFVPRIGSGILSLCARNGCNHSFIKHLPREDQPSP